MYCISCGANLPDNARYCAVCGAEVYNPANAAEDAVEETAVDGVDAASEQPAKEEGSAAEGEAAASEEAQRGKIRMKVKNPALLQDSGPLVLPEIGTSGPLDVPEISQSGPVSLPEIDPANPENIPPREGREDDVSVSADVTVVMPRGPFKPSYGPLSPSDLFEPDGTTAKMPRIETANGEVLVSGDSEAKNFVQSNTIPKRWTPLRVFVLVAMVLVAIALAIAAVQLYSQRLGDVHLGLRDRLFELPAVGGDPPDGALRRAGGCVRGGRHAERELEERGRRLQHLLRRL